MSWPRAATTDLRQLDTATRVPPAVIADLTALTQLTISTKLSVTDLEAPFTPTLTLFSDASNEALAAVFRNADHLDVHSWPTDTSLTIFAREALAHLLAVSTVPRTVRTVGAAIDNTNVLAAIFRGHAMNPVVNNILRAYYRLLADRELSVSACFVPSSRQLADPSRQQPLLLSWPSYFSQPVNMRRLPVFKPPAKEGGGS